MKHILLTILLITYSNAERPNFIFILSDDQSWKGSSVLMDPNNPESKSDYYLTPNMEKLFASGMRFSHGYAPAPYCCPTRRSIQIGQSPARHIYQKDQVGWVDYYKKQINIPQTLKKIDPNYRTAHFGKWDHRFDEVSPEQVGYDKSDGATGNGEGGSRNSGGPAAKEDPKLIDHITDSAIDFMKNCQKEKKPFYVQLSHYAVHLDIFYKQKTLDLLKSRPLGKLHKYPEFAAMTEDMDSSMGRLLQELSKLGLKNNTYIIFMSDNGGREDLPDHKSANLNTPLRSGKGKMYEGGIRVPFTISGPGIKAGSHSKVSVSGVDILPTIASFAGGTAQHERLDGGSMKPLLLGKAKEVKRNNDFLIFHHAIKRKPQTAIIKGDYKLVKTWKNDLVELFDLSNDLSENKNLAKKKPKKTEELLQKIENYLANNKSSTEYKPESKKKKKGK
jgi:arylsulfatase A|tara:strand:+ start:810 stop:2147 length:1338 start_codon:yes stop_codon:yes gene_type:complete